MTADTFDAGLRLLEIEPTVFFVRGAEGLEQAVDLTLAHEGEPVQAVLAVRAAGRELRTDLGTVEPGQSRRRVTLPDIREAIPVEFALTVGGAEVHTRTLTWAPARHWEVHLVHGSHHDLGYTDLPSNLLREHDTFLDSVLRWCDETSDWPEESRFHYTVEQAWSILHYMEHRPPEVIERLVRLMREGRVEVTALLGNETSELCGSEEQIRLAYPAFRLRRCYGIPIRTAELNDVPGLSWGLVSVLAGAGVRYFAPGIPDYYGWGKQWHALWDEAAVLPRDMTGAFWWEGPDGQRVLLYYGHGVGLWTPEQAEDELGRALLRLAERGYPAGPVRFKFQGGGRDNAPPDVRLSLIAREWNSRWAYPKLIVSTNARFFERFESAVGDQLPVLRGDLPNTDYTIGAMSTAKETGVNRLTHDTLTSAEKLAACASLVSDYEYPAETLAEAYDSMLLFDEHTWGMCHPTGPAEEANWAQKAQFAYRAAALAHDVLSKSTNRIADAVQRAEEGYHLVVFNPLAERRSDLVRVEGITAAPCGRPMHWRQPEGERSYAVWIGGTADGRNLVDLPAALLEAPFELIDVETGRRVPHQVVTLEDPLAARPFAAYRYGLGGEDGAGFRALIVDSAHRKEIVFVAEDVPALGYRTYRIVPCAAPPSLPSSLRSGEGWLENRFYRIELDPVTGAITRLYDKELDREWVDAGSPYGVNRLLVRSSRTGEVQAAGRAEISRGEDGPVCASLIVRSSGPGCPQMTQEITLYDSLKRIDLANRLLRDSTPFLEHYFAFPFAAGERPRFRFEAPNAVIEPVRDQLPGSNTDAYAVQHWVTVADEQGTLAWSPLEAPVVALGDLWVPPLSQAHHAATSPGYGHDFLRDPEQWTRGHIYSYAMLSNYRTNFRPVQPGEALFRYSLTTFPSAQAESAARDFGWAAASPLAPVVVHGPQAGSLPAVAGFCRVEPSHVLALTLKAAEDGDGLIVRLAETEGRAVRVTLTLPHMEIAQAFACNLVEENQSVLPHDQHTVQVQLPARGIATIRCRGRRWPAVRSFCRYNL